MVPDEQVPGIVSVAVLVASAVVGAELAQAVGAYGVILFAWFFGVIVGVYRSPPAPRWQLAGFVVVTLGVTLGITTAAAQLLAEAVRAWMPWAAGVSATDLLFPVAFLLPAIGHGWKDVARWLWSLRSRAQRQPSNEGDPS